MTNKELIEALNDAVRRERHCTAEVVERLAEFDSKKLWRDEGYAHLFAYCTEALRYSESAAGKRIYVARLAQRHKEIFGLLREGKLHLGGLVVLGPALEGPDAALRIKEACGKSRREIERMIARLAPVPPKPDVIRKVSAAPAIAKGAMLEGRSPETTAFALQQRIEPAAPNRSRISFDADDEVVALIERAREVMRHKYPFAGIEDIVREALTMLLEKRDPEKELKLGRTASTKPKAPSDKRGIPRWVRQLVWKRDVGTCAFISEEGRRCGTRGWLEYDHVLPFAKGGRSDDPANVRLLCRHHNQLMAERHFGPAGPQELPLK